jgi:hypothetical protein
MARGPGLDAALERVPVLMADLADPCEVRWPGYGPTVLAHQIRAVFSSGRTGSRVLSTPISESCCRTAFRS